MSYFKYLALGVVLMSAPAFAQGMMKPMHGAQATGLANADDALALPAEDFRATWAHLGSYVVPDTDAPGYGFHDVYAQREQVAVYKATGQWPDGTMLIKEIRSLVSKDQTTGQAYNAGDIGVWFVMVKDSTKRHEASSKHWLNGWGWALYKVDDPKKNVSESAEKTCLECHRPAENTDWVFTEGYPTLR